MSDVEQRTEAWHLQRLGKVTASRVADVIAKTKSGYSASRENYMAQLVVERLTNKPSEGFTCLLYTSPSPRDRQKSRMPSSA